jgi:hypothetical protein
MTSQNYKRKSIQLITIFRITQTKILSHVTNGTYAGNQQFML